MGHEFVHAGDVEGVIFGRGQLETWKNEKPIEFLSQDLMQRVGSLALVEATKTRRRMATRPWPELATFFMTDLLESADSSDPDAELPFERRRRSVHFDCGPTRRSDRCAVDDDVVGGETMAAVLSLPSHR